MRGALWGVRAERMDAQAAVTMLAIKYAPNCTFRFYFSTIVRLPANLGVGADQRGPGTMLIPSRGIKTGWERRSPRLMCPAPGPLGGNPSTEFSGLIFFAGFDSVLNCHMTLSIEGFSKRGSPPAPPVFCGLVAYRFDYH